MRDPKTLAFSILRPWPEIHPRPDNPLQDAKGWFNWTIRLHRRPYFNLYISPFIEIGKHQLYFPEIIGIWHTDPLGDVGPPCHGRKWWKYHLTHLSVQWTFWQSFVQKHIRKCAWCGKKSSKELGRVNHSDGRTVYHATCSSEASKAYHAHDPMGCWPCKQKTLPEITLRMPYEQRELLDSLRVQVDLGLMDKPAAVAAYNKKREAARWH